MKKFLLGTVALLAVGTAANAADLARRYTKAPEPVAPAFSWTGFYLNGGGGYGIWSADGQATDAGTGFGFSGRTGGRFLSVDDCGGGCCHRQMGSDRKLQADRKAALVQFCMAQ